MVEEIIDVGTSKFNIEEIWFKKFCNKYEKEMDLYLHSSRFMSERLWEREK